MNRHRLLVKKRDGTLVPVRFDEITDRLANLCEKEPKLDYSINPFDITKSILDRIKNGITTSEIDDFAAELCAHNLDHPDYYKLASRLIISNHQKNLKTSTGILFSEVCRVLYENKDQNGSHCPILNKTFYEISQKWSDKLDSIIDLERDFKIDYFGFKTLHNAYLLKYYNNGKHSIVECPQHVYLRVALAIECERLVGAGLSELSDLPDDFFEKVTTTYDFLSNKYYTHATPTLYNAGINRQQLFSCFLMTMGDSVDEIFKCYGDAAKISKWAGGIGIAISDVRGHDSYVRGTGGRSDGLKPMLKVLNSIAGYINQGSRRNGSFAVYLEPWHVDIFDFLAAGNKHKGSAPDIFYALWNPSLFIESVEKDDYWYLMCPSECPKLTEVYGTQFNELYHKYVSEGRYRRKVKAMEIWDAIINSQIETGMPYMCYKDHVNSKTNHQNIGVIKSSNLCVAPETRILTKEGYLPIKALKDKEVFVWNGEEWSKTTVKQTGSNQKLLKVSLSNGSVIQCTEYHKFILYDETIVEAKDLKEGHRLIDFKLPEETKIPSEISNIILEHGNFNCCGCTEVDLEKDKLVSLMLSLQTCGIKSHINNNKKLIINSFVGSSDTNAAKKYMCDGCLREFIYDNKVSRVDIRVVSVIDEGRVDDTYCFTEEKKNRGFFEGILTMNCSEIVEYHSTEKYACCCLASIILPTYVNVDPLNGPVFDYEQLIKVAQTMTRNLDLMIDFNYYPVPETRLSNESERPIGIGVQGLADVFVKMGVAFDSPEAAVINKKIFESIYYGALLESCNLAKEKGTYKSYKGSPISKGIFQFDMWPSFDKESLVYKERWELLRQEILKYGVRNSLVTTCMPTASTASIANSTECIEPISSNMYVRKVLAGNYIITNKYLSEELVKQGLWTKKIVNEIINNDGSIQAISGIPDSIKNIFKISWEIKQRVLIDLAADRGPFIDQSQSLNLFFAVPDFQNISNAHIYGHNKGLKTGMYYLRQKASKKSEKITSANPRVIPVTVPVAVPQAVVQDNLKEEQKDNGVKPVVQQIVQQLILQDHNLKEDSQEPSNCDMCSG
jgi:ribonucleotide reductase alpha subunit